MHWRMNNIAIDVREHQIEIQGFPTGQQPQARININAPLTVVPHGRSEILP